MGDAPSMKKRNAVIIEAIVVDPPVVFPGDTATITIHARSGDGGPLSYEVSVSEGVIEPTDEANVFLWHVPESADADRADPAGFPPRGALHARAAAPKEIVTH